MRPSDNRSTMKSVALLVAVVATASLSLTAATQVSPETSQHTNYLRKLSSSRTPNGYRGNGPFVDGAETFYNDFSLAWRFLGFHTDCNVCVVEEEQNNGDDDNNNNDGEEKEERIVASSECLENGEDRTVCHRYALWASYVDESYEGKGPAEYQHFDHRTGHWDKSACNNNNGGRCAKLDCHDPSSHFKLVGVYKDPQPNTFVENVVDYQGDCVWNDAEYKFMKAITGDENESGDEASSSSLPLECSAYQVVEKDGTIYSGYYDAIPTSKGNLGVALYSDEDCTQSYEGTGHTVQDVLTQSTGISGNLLLNELTSWNDAMDAFKVCQPCVAYDTLSNKYAEGYNSVGDRYGEDYDDENEDTFVCRNNLQRDEPVNQCKVFVEEGKDSMAVANYRDILLAESQGTITGIDFSPSNGKRRGKMVFGESFMYTKHTWLSVLFLLISAIIFFSGLTQLFEKHSSKLGPSGMDLNKPLVGVGDRTDETEGETKNKKSIRNMIGTTVVATTAATTTMSAKEKKAAEKAQKKHEKEIRQIEKQLEQKRKQEEQQQAKEQKKLEKQEQKRLVAEGKPNSPKRSFAARSILKKSSRRDDDDDCSDYSDDSRH